MQYTNNVFSLLSDITVPFAISDVSKEVSLKVILFNKNQLQLQQQVQQEEQATSIKVPQMILRMDKNDYGQFETSVSLKAVVKALYAGKSLSKGDSDAAKQLHDNLKQNLKCLHFVFETDGKCLRTDRYWSVKQTANCLGPVAAHALGGLQQVNERNVESEVQEMLKPLQ